MSVNADSKTYSIHFMDGYDREDVLQRELRKVLSREKKIGKKFFDKGDYTPDKKRKTTDFEKGEFTVLCYQPRSGIVIGVREDQV